MLIVVGAVTVIVAVALLRWSQPLHPVAVGVDAWATSVRRRAERRTAVRAVAARRRTSVPARVAEPVAQSPAPAAVVPAAVDAPLDAQADRHLVEVFAHLEGYGVAPHEAAAAPIEAEAAASPEQIDVAGPAEVGATEIEVEMPEPEAAPAVVAEAADQRLGSPVRDHVEDIVAEAREDDEARQDDEAWERVLGLLRRTDTTGVEASEDAHAQAPSPRLTIVPAQRLAQESGAADKELATVGAPAKVRRCGVCREPGHDRRRCPEAEAVRAS